MDGCQVEQEKGTCVRGTWHGWRPAMSVSSCCLSPEPKLCLMQILHAKGVASKTVAKSVCGTHLRHQLPVDRHTRAAVKVQPPAVTAALVGVQVHAARLAFGVGWNGWNGWHGSGSVGWLAGRRTWRISGATGGRAWIMNGQQPTLAVAPRIRSSRVSSLRSWWCEPEPLLMISTPARHSGMCGAAGVNSSSHVSAAVARVGGMCYILCEGSWAVPVAPATRRQSRLG